MDHEYIRQVESPITPPKKSACVLGGKLAAGQRFVRGKRGRVEGRVERVDRKSWGREEREDAKRFGEKRLAKIQTVIARACLSGARPEYFSLLFSVSGPLFISCQPSPLARLRLPRSYSSPCCCSSSRPLPSLLPFPPSFFSSLPARPVRAPFFTIARGTMRASIDRNTVWNIRWRFIYRGKKSANAAIYQDITWVEKELEGKWVEVAPDDLKRIMDPVKLRPWGDVFRLGGR